jgi:hypothetical protein
MEKNLKLSIALLLMVVVILAAGAAALFFMRQSEIEKRIALEKRVEELNMETTRLSRELEDAAIVKKDLELKLENVEGRVKVIEVQLVDEKKAKESAFSQLEVEKKESRKLVDELMKIKDEKEKIAVSLTAANAQIESVRSQLNRMQEAKDVLEKKLRDYIAKSEVELEKIVVKPEEAAPEPESETAQETPPQGQPPAKSMNIMGEVLVVNKKFDFVVVNLGEADGITPGMDLGVYRDQKFIAILQVEKVHANMSAAKIPAEWKSVDIKEGDKIAVVK